MYNTHVESRKPSADRSSSVDLCLSDMELYMWISFPGSVNKLPSRWGGKLLKTSCHLTVSGDCGSYLIFAPLQQGASALRATKKIRRNVSPSRQLNNNFNDSKIANHNDMIVIGCKTYVLHGAAAVWLGRIRYTQCVRHKSHKETHKTCPSWCF